MIQSEINKKYVDGWYSWIVCFVSFLSEFIVMGFYTSFGIIFVALVTEFGVSETLAAWIGSVSWCICFLSSFLVNLFIGSLGYRPIACLGAVLFGSGLFVSSYVDSVYLLFVSYGLIGGIGSSFIHFTGILVLPRFFKLKRSLAYGIALSGHGIGAIPVGYLMEFLIETYGLRVAFRVFSIFSVPLFLGALTYVPVKSLCQKLPILHDECYEIPPKVKKRTKKKFDFSVWKNKALISHVAAFWAYGFGYYVPSVHLVNMAEGLGVPTYQATFLPSSIALAQSFGKIIFGRLIMCWRLNSTYACQITLFICSLVTTLCPLASGFSGLFAYTLIFGFFDSCSTLLTLSIIEEIVGETNLDSGYALQMVGMSFFMLVGPPSAGFLYEATGSYHIPFYVSGGFQTACVCIMFITPLLRDNDQDEDLIMTLPRKLSTSSIKSTVSKSSKDSGISVHSDNNNNKNNNNNNKDDCLDIDSFKSLSSGISVSRSSLSSSQKTINITDKKSLDNNKMDLICDDKLLKEVNSWNFEEHLDCNEIGRLFFVIEKETVL